MSDTDTLGPLYASVNIALLVLAIISVLLRCYIRFGVIKAVGNDDYWILVATASFISCTTTDLLGIKYGSGQHIWNIPPANIPPAFKFNYASEITYGITMICSKISIACFLLRITPHRIQRNIIYFITGLSCVIGLALVFIVTFQCRPLSRAWDRGQPGTCISLRVIRSALYTYSALALVTDFTLTLLPLFIIWKLQIEWQSKIALVPIMSLAFLASIAVIVRIPLIQDFTENDFLYATARFAIWSVVEQGLAITAASLATLRPLLIKLSKLITSMSFPSIDMSRERGGREAYSTRARRDANLEWSGWNGQYERASDVISLRASERT